MVTVIKFINRNSHNLVPYEIEFHIRVAKYSVVTNINPFIDTGKPMLHIQIAIISFKLCFFAGYQISCIRVIKFFYFTNIYHMTSFYKRSGHRVGLGGCDGSK